MLFISVNISAISCELLIQNFDKFYYFLILLLEIPRQTIPVESQVKGVCNDSTEIQSRSSRNKRKTSESFNQTETKIFERFELDGADVKYTWDFFLGLVCYTNI